MGEPGKYFQRFFRDPGFRLRVWARYVHHKSIYAKGESEIGFLRNAVFGFQSFMVGWLFLRSVFPSLPAWVLGILFPTLLLLKVAVYYSVGRMWDREKIFMVERTWSNERDPIARTISRDLLHGSGLEVK